MPRWVKVFALVSVSLVVLVGAVMLLAGGAHGPGRHGFHGQGDHGDPSPVAPGAREVEVRADRLAFEPAEIRARAGEDLAIVLTAVDQLHDFTIDELDAHVAAEAGRTERGGLHAAQPGRYVYYCSVPGHRAAGMEGVLVVEEAGHLPPPHGGA